jgi:rhomboid protease GluP
MQSAEPVDILVTPEREHCVELQLALAAQGIDSQIRWNGRFWAVSVAADTAVAAYREMSAYAAEERRPAPAPVRLPSSGQAWPGILIYVAVITIVALLAANLWLGVDWLSVGRMDGGRLRAGDWWRAVTALTLHADPGHLLGNAFFGSFFGYSAARYLGGGFAWLAILLTGATGNLINGLVSGAAHRSIGASTAVFAALGLISAYVWRRGFPTSATRRERLAPVVAGIGLLAFTGTGGVDTDIGAHLWGFAAGFGAGLLIARMGFPLARSAQLACGLCAIAIVVAAWTAAVV